MLRIDCNGDSDKDQCVYCEIDRLTAQLADLDAEIARLKDEIYHYEDQGLWIPDKEAKVRKQAAQECVEILRFYNGVEGIADQIMKKFGLEG